MRFHDFHLAAYTVSDFGATIVLDLLFEGFVVAKAVGDGL